MSLPVRLEQVEAGGVEREAAEFQRTYEAMYGLSVGEAAFVPSLLAEHAARDGFRLCAAYDTEGVMAGFAYGFTGEAGQLWHDEMAAAVGEYLTAEWLTGCFEFAEFGVIPELRRRGIGSALYAAVFADLPHTRAVLTVRVGNEPAMAFYSNRGWMPVFAGFVPTGGHGPYTIMGKDRRPG